MTKSVGFSCRLLVVLRRVYVMQGTMNCHSLNWMPSWTPVSGDHRLHHLNISFLTWVAIRGSSMLTSACHRSNSIQTSVSASTQNKMFVSSLSSIKWQSSKSVMKISCATTTTARGPSVPTSGGCHLRKVCVLHKTLLQRQHHDPR